MQQKKTTKLKNQTFHYTAVLLRSVLRVGGAHLRIIAPGNTATCVDVEAVANRFCNAV